ncbi:MAG: pyrimidine 5'-nucleotidase [Rhodospirillaceae bacterium]|nr:pyrimidine 5'-nucleotidase [Rhodospirillaceae bacterium]
MNRERPDHRHLGARTETWIFDLDNTFYRPTSRLFDQIDARMKAFIARELGLSLAEAFVLQKKYFREFGTTLRGLMNNHGTSPDAFLDFVHDIDHSVLTQDGELSRAIEQLPGRKIIFTNGTAFHAERVIERLGCSAHIDDIFDIRAARYMPKPNHQPYHDLLVRHGIAPKRAVMIEDSQANLKPAADLGMTTVLVHDASGPHPEPGAAHCDFVIDDLPRWLRAAATGQDNAPHQPVTPPC